VAATTGVVQSHSTRGTNLDRCLVGHGPSTDLVEVRHIGHAFAVRPDRRKPSTFAVGIGEIERERSCISREVAQRDGEVDNDLAIGRDLADCAAYDSTPVTRIKNTDGWTRHEHGSGARSGTSSTGNGGAGERCHHDKREGGNGDATLGNATHENLTGRADTHSSAV
jgi:hypothetical protein